MNFVLTNKKFKTCQYLNQYDIKLRNSFCKNKIIKKKLIQSISIQKILTIIQF